MINYKDILAIISPVMSALVIWYIQRSQIRRDKERDAQALKESERLRAHELKLAKEAYEMAQCRKQEMLLSLRMIKAVGKLSYANATALKEGRVNGTMEDALAYYRAASEDLTNFLQEQATEHYSR